MRRHRQQETGNTATVLAPKDRLWRQVFTGRFRDLGYPLSMTSLIPGL